MPISTVLVGIPTEAVCMIWFTFNSNIIIGNYQMFWSSRAIDCPIITVHHFHLTENNCNSQLPWVVKYWAEWQIKEKIYVTKYQLLHSQWEGSEVQVCDENCQMYFHIQLLTVLCWMWHCNKQFQRTVNNTL